MSIATPKAFIFAVFPRTARDAQMRSPLPLTRYAKTFEADADATLLFLFFFFFRLMP